MSEPGLRDGVRRACRMLMQAAFCRDLPIGDLEKRGPELARAVVARLRVRPQRLLAKLKERFSTLLQDAAFQVCVCVG